MQNPTDQDMNYHLFTLRSFQYLMILASEYYNVKSRISKRGIAFSVTIGSALESFVPVWSSHPFVRRDPQQLDIRQISTVSNMRINEHVGEFFCSFSSMLSLMM